MGLPERADGVRTQENLEFWFDDKALMQCIERGQVRHLAQPVVAANGRVAGVELLVRVEHPEFGRIAAARFMHNIVEAQTYAAILALSLDSAGTVLAMAPDALHVAINISELDLLNPAVYTLLKARAKSQPRQVSRMVLEISERIDFASHPRLAHAIEKIRQLGYGFALDDFMSDNSTTFPLRQFDLKAVKLDMSICKSYRDNVKDFVLIKTFVYYCRLMGVSLVAEGVEERDQFIELRAMGVQQFQGYLFSPPLLLTELPQRLKALGLADAETNPSSGMSWRDMHSLSAI